MIRVAIVDDDALYIKEMNSHLMQFKKEHHSEIQMTQFSSGFELMSDYKPVYDILLLDIEMPYFNGMELAKAIRLLDPYAVIVFITNTAKYAINGYEVNAFDYMMKPIDYTQFEIKFQAAVDSMVKKSEMSILVPTKDGSRHIKAQDILYIEVRDHWLHFFTKSGEYKMFGMLKEFETKLKDHHFIKCNKSNLINLQYVTRLRNDSLIVFDRDELKVSRSKRKEVQTAFIEYYNQMSWQMNHLDK